MLSNTITQVKGRVESNKEVSVEQRNELVELAQKRLSGGLPAYRWNANICGIIIRLVTNSPHLYDFWVENWFAAPRSREVLPHGVIYAVTGIEGCDPYAYYNHETKTAVFINTEYYGQCKSWALGMAADLLETQHNIHSIHGSCAVLDGKGVVIIAPTGTGKSTHTWGLMHLPEGKIHSDDWIFLKYKENLATADISEHKFYLRTDMVTSYPKLKALLDRCKCENVENKDYTAFGNSRAILDPEWIGGPDKVVANAVVKSVILLRRDKDSPAELKLTGKEAIDILEEGKYQVLSGAGGNIGDFSYESFYNPYLLVKRPEVQKRFFARLFEAATCHMLNTGVETVEETQERIRRIIQKA